jgi:signal peptidase I
MNGTMNTVAKDQHQSVPKAADDSWRESIKTVLYAVILAIIIRTLVFEPFSIPSKSMVPTLLVGDYLIVTKYSYGYSRYSLPFSLPLFEGRLQESKPTRGDVVVFKLPRDNRTDYIKRVIGLPGDEIQVKKGILYVNGKSVTRAKLPDYVDDDGRGGENKFNQFRETLPDPQKNHLILEKSDDERLDNTPAYKVPEGHYFMMGDNRDNSMDSRVESMVGFVPAENLIGKAQYVFFSVGTNSAWWQIWNWPSSIRFDRLLVKIE